MFHDEAMAHVHELTTVDGVIVFDLDPSTGTTSAGGTRLADDVRTDEVALLARAMTYKFAAFGIRLGGAKAGIRPRLLDSRDETMARYCAEIEPLVRAGTFVTGPDLGTFERDFASINGESVFRETVDGVGFEDLVTGLGVVAAAEAWLVNLTGRRIAIEGFGKVGGGVARAAVERGAVVVGVSTIRGAVATAGGFALDALFEGRAEHGDAFVEHLGLEVHPPADLHRLPVDVLVPGARTGVLDRAQAAKVRARVVAPAANVPYTDAGLAVLRANGVAALPDFVCNAGAVLAYRSPPGLTAREVLARVERLIGEAIGGARAAGADPYDWAVIAAETFLRTWVPEDELPDGPPLAPEPT